MKVLALLAGFILALAFNLVPAVPFNDASSATVRASARAASTSPVPASEEDPQERELFDLLNGERTRAGMPALAWDERLAEAAQRHSALMAGRHQLSHDLSGEPPLRQRLSAVPLDRSGENVGEDSSVAGAHSGFMHSPPHRENIMNSRYDAVGIGIVESGRTLWVTEDFASRVAEVSGATATKTVADLFARTRADAGLPQLPYASSKQVQKLACDMGQRDELSSSPALSLPESRYVVAYTATDLNHFPADAKRLTTKRDVQRYSVGTCFARTERYPSGVYWVLMVLFSK